MFVRFVKRKTNQQVLHTRILCGVLWSNVYHRHFARLNNQPASSTAKIALMCILSFIFFEWCYKFCVFPHLGDETGRDETRRNGTKRTKARQTQILYIMIAKNVIRIIKTSLWQQQIKNKSIPFTRKHIQTIISIECNCHVWFSVTLTWQINHTVNASICDACYYKYHIEK